MPCVSWVAELKLMAFPSATPDEPLSLAQRGQVYENSPFMKSNAV